MPDLLLELRSEEIPARMQRKAAGDLKKMVTDGLVEAGLTYEAAREYWTPRRLVLDLRGLTARSKDVHEERKGPSTKAPEQAIQGFLRSAGLASIVEAHVHSDPKKGDFYVAHVSKPGRAAVEIIAELIPSVIRGFPWPKSMRWGPASGPKGTRYQGADGRGGDTLRWVRPLQSIVCTFGPETEEPMVIDFEVDGIRSGNVTYGHRFHAPDAISVRRFGDYAAKLEAAKVVIDADRRKEMILSDARNLAFASGLELIEDEGLLEEVSGLVEWPVVLLGSFEEEFLAIPAEVIRLTIRANQKCFVTRPQGGHPTPDLRSDPPHRGEGGEPALPTSSPSMGEVARRAGGGDTTLSNRFLLTANIEAKDGGAEIVHGNGKVVRARLADALYFWKTDQGDLPDLVELKQSAEKFGLDLKKPLDQRMARLDRLGVTFHAKLGTQGERVERIARLAEELAPIVAKAISPLEGEMSPKATEGGAVAPTSPWPNSGNIGGRRSTLPPSALPGISPARGEIADLARRAAVLAKADLTTEIVGEFPELQGAMGRKYAALQGEHPSVAAAIEEHYKPQGPSDRVPTDPVSVAVALADKLDTLVGFWAIGETPTGSKDPYALRRAALGVVRIVVESRVRLSLSSIIRLAHPLVYQRFVLIFRLLIRDEEGYFEYPEIWRDLNWPLITDEGEEIWPVEKIHFPPSSDIWVYERELVPPNHPDELPDEISFQGLTVQGKPAFDRRAEIESRSYKISSALLVTRDLLSFFHDRLKVYLRDQGAQHDLIDAVLASGGLSPLEGEMAAKQPEGVGQGSARRKGTSSAAEATPPGGFAATLPSRGREGAANDDLLMIVRRVEALGSFLSTEDGKNLLAGTKRAANILAAEEKKKTAVASAVDAGLFNHPAEEVLHAAVNQAERQAAQAIQNEDFSAAMLALSALREPVDSFFEQVLVNDEDAAIRANRLALLARIRAATDQVADFSKIAG